MAFVYRITIPSKNIDESVSFYQSLLELSGNRVSPGRHYFDCGGIIIGCYDAQANGDARIPNPNDDYIYFAVDDIEATHARAQAVGAPLEDTDLPGVGILGQVMTRPWGERSFYTRDPSGNPLCFTARETLFTTGTLP